jgi:hypothetical protein
MEVMRRGCRPRRSRRTRSPVRPREGLEGADTDPDVGGVSRRAAATLYGRPRYEYHDLAELFDSDSAPNGPAPSATT